MIYIHIPFCRSFCTYCDFYSEVASKCKEKENEQSRMFEAFSDALGREIAQRADEMTDDFNTVYIGGGTPSVLPLHIYENLVKSLEEAGIRPPFREFTFELNPEDVVEKGEAYIRGLMELGVDRFSMGVQSFDDGILKWMNRRHDSLTARIAYGILEKAGASNISIDLIFGLPQLDDSLWSDTVRQALEISQSGKLPCHISAYQLSVEPGSALAAMVDKSQWAEASQEKCARQYAILCEILAEHGYHHYEISNFALPGFEARHNGAYWKHEPYVGLGPGAHSFLVSNTSDGGNCRGGESELAASYAGEYIRQWNEPDLKAYLENPTGNQGREELDGEQIALEKIMLALRTSDGIDGEFLVTCCGEDKLISALESGNLVACGNGRYRIPENRFFVSDSIILELV